MRRHDCCVFSTDNKVEASAVRDKLGDRGVDVSVRIDTRSDLFGIRTIAGPQVLLSGTYQIMVAETDRDKVLEILPDILETLDRESEYLISDSLPQYFSRPVPADDADLDRDDRWWFQRSLALSLVPLLGFGFIAFLRYGRGISEANRTLKRIALLFAPAMQLLYAGLLLLANQLLGRPGQWSLLVALIIGIHCATALIFLFTHRGVLISALAAVPGLLILILWMIV